MTEQRLHESVAQFLNVALPFDAWHTALDSAQPSARAGRMLKARGGKRGIADHWLIVPGFPWIFFELKTTIGRLTSEQILFGDMVRVNGGLWFVARSLADVAEALRTIGIPLRTAAFAPRPAATSAAPVVKRAARTPKAVPRYVFGKRVVNRARKQGIRV